MTAQDKISQIAALLSSTRCVDLAPRPEELAPRSFLFMASLPIENGSGSPLRPLPFF